MSTRDKLAADLVATGYLNLFQRMTFDALDRFWNAPRGPDELRALAGSPTSPPAAAFLAAEILFLKGGYTPSPTDAQALAPAYAHALAHNVVGSANPWGKPGSLDGDATKHAVSLGEAAVPPFRALLDDATPMTYAGSREATFGNAYRWRVKDAAAVVLAAIRGLRFDAKKTPAARDPEIAALKAQLASKGS
jgi:hypothetical protein